jgi:DNA-binding GntR family transcriptional regulator
MAVTERPIGEGEPAGGQAVPIPSEPRRHDPSKRRTTVPHAKPSDLATVVQIRRPQTLTEAVVSYVRDAVVLGHFPPGSPLPEVQLATQLNTSRGTVREALRALQELGLVEVLPHRGAYVTDISVARTRDLIELRSLLEGHAARRALEGGPMPPDSSRRLEDAYETMMRTAKGSDESTAIESHLDFHLAVAKAGGNELLIDLVAPLQLQTRRLIAYTQLLGSGDDEGHTAIMDVLRGSDAERAERVVREHIERSGDLVIARLEEDLERRRIGT